MSAKVDFLTACGENLNQDVSRCFIGGLVVIILPLYDFKKDYDANQALKAKQASKLDAGPQAAAK